jgi:hypothetical protein
VGSNSTLSVAVCPEFSVSGKVAPETVKPAPLTVAALMVTAAVPVDDKVSVLVAEEFTFTLPKARLEALSASWICAAPNCRENVLVTLPARAVRVTACATFTAVTVAGKLALTAPAGTVTDVGTETALLLLARLTANPPLAAAAFIVTVQVSVPAPVIDPLAHVNPVSTGTPVPLRPTDAVVPVEELLFKVSAPETAPAAVGANCRFSVAV